MAANIRLQLTSDVGDVRDVYQLDRGERCYVEVAVVRVRGAQSGEQAAVVAYVWPGRNKRMESCLKVFETVNR